MTLIASIELLRMVWTNSIVLCEVHEAMCDLICEESFISGFDVQFILHGYSIRVWIQSSYLEYISITSVYSTTHLI